MLFALAQREIFHNRVTLGRMDTKTLHFLMTVDKVLQDWPSAFSVFMKQFCTLKDVAETYQISIEKLMEEIMDVSE